MGKFNLSVVTNTARGNNTSALAEYVEENEARGKAEALLRVPEERLSERIVNRGETIEGLGDLPITSSLENDADARALAEGYEKKRNSSKIDYTNPAVLDQTPTEAQVVQDYEVGTTDATLPQPTPPTAQQTATLINQNRFDDDIPAVGDLTALVPDGIGTYLDLEEAVFGSFNKIDKAISDPVNSRLKLEEPVLTNAFNKVVSSTANLTGINKLDTDVVAKAFTFATFDTLLDKQAVDESKAEKLAERAARGEIENEGAYDDEVAGINTEQDAKTIFDTTSRILGSTLGLPPEASATLFDNILPKEKSMLTNVLLQNMQDNGVIYSVGSGNVEQVKWLPSTSFDSVKASVPDLVAALGKAREKAPSNIPNNNGIPGTTKRAIQGSTGRTHADYQAVWNAKVSAAMNYLGTTPWQVFDDPVNLELAFMQEVVYFGTDGGNPAGDGAKFTMISQDGQGEPLNIGSPPVDPRNPRAQNVSITEQPMLSEHPIANHFKADLDHFTSAFNKGRLQNVEEAASKSGEFVSDSSIKLLRDVLTKEEVEQLLLDSRTPAFWNQHGPFVSSRLVNKLNNAAMAHNSAVAQYLKSPLEANSIRGEVKYSHVQQIGASGRLRISDNTMNPQSNPSDRGVIISSHPFVINPKNNGEVEKNAKAIMARTFDWSIPRPKRGGGTEEVKAENLPRREDRIKIYEEFTASPAGKETLDVARLLTGFDSNNTWNMKDAISADGIVQLRDTYNNIKRSGVSQGQPVSYNRRALAAFQQAVGPAGKGVGASPAINIEQWENIARVLGDAKEGSLKLNNLIALGRFDAGLPFNGATLVGEMDGTNNSFAILSILLGDLNLAERSGIINKAFGEEGAAGFNRVVSEGDMRRYMHEKAMEIADVVIGSSKDSKAVAAAQAMKDVLPLIPTGNIKSAWKDIIMQAGYGKDMNSFESQWVDQLSGIPGMDQAKLEASAPFVGVALGNALSGLKSYLELTKTTGTLISLLNQDYTYVSSTGMPLALVDSGRRPASRGFVSALGDTSSLAINTIVGSEKAFKPDPLRSHLKTTDVNDPIARAELESASSPAASTSVLETETHFDPITYNYIRKALQEGGSNEAKIFEAIRKIPFIQRNRAPVNPIHGEDASVMIDTINEISRLNESKYKHDPLWFYQTFDAVTVNAKSYQVVPYAYNTNLERVISKIDRYGQDLQELQRAKKAAIKEGDPRVASILLAMAGKSDAETKAAAAKIAMLREKAAKQSKQLLANFGRSTIDDDFEGVDSSSANVDGWRLKDYKTFEEKQRGLDKALAKVREDNKVPAEVMERLFKRLTVFDKHVADLKAKRKTMLESRKKLLAVARKHHIADSELPTFLNLT